MSVPAVIVAMIIAVGPVSAVEEQSFEEVTGQVGQSQGPNAFFGHYNYLIELPKGYSAVAGFEDPERLVEFVILHPVGAPKELVASELRREFREDLYSAQGIIRIEVSPRDHPQFGGGSADLEVLRGAIPAHLNHMGERFSVEDVSLRYPAFQILIDEPQPLHQVFIEGGRALYIFTAGRDNAALQAVIQSLKELDEP